MKPLEQLRLLDNLRCIEDPSEMVIIKKENQYDQAGIFLGFNDPLAVFLFEKAQSGDTELSLINGEIVLEIDSYRILDTCKFFIFNLKSITHRVEFRHVGVTRVYTTKGHPFNQARLLCKFYKTESPV